MTSLRSYKWSVVRRASEWLVTFIDLIAEGRMTEGGLAARVRIFDGLTIGLIPLRCFDYRSVLLVMQ